MSYCVNCGVELDGSLKECPLCNTIVYNPKEFGREKQDSPFPKERGEVEKVKKKDLGILLTVVLVAIGATCGVLNLLVFQGSPWSLLVIGACLCFWVLFVPLIIYQDLSVYSTLFFDGLAVGIYLYLITFVTHSDGWFYGLAIPIVAVTVLVAELFAFCLKKLPVTFLTTCLYVFTAIGVLCLLYEILIDRYLQEHIQLMWSAVVLTVCAVIDITLITMLSRRRLRDAVRRRFHF